MKSMTGYGQGIADGDTLKIMAEIKAVNNRYCEIIVKQPRQYLALEDKIKKYINQYIERGRVEVFINVKSTGVLKTSSLNVQQALEYNKNLKLLADELGVEYRPDVYRLANMPEVIEISDEEEDMDEVWSVLEQALHQALENHMDMRNREGKAIGEDMLIKLGNLEEFREKIVLRAPVVAGNFREKLMQRLNDALGENMPDEDRVAQEVAMFSDRVCIDEELVRLNSHFAQFREIVQADGSVGRKLDFLIQEMNRETNTIGSKANDSEISAVVVEMKSELEKLREQVQNIE